MWGVRNGKTKEKRVPKQEMGVGNVIVVSKLLLFGNKWNWQEVGETAQKCCGDEWILNN